MIVPLVLLLFSSSVRCHCPHLAKMNKVEGPSPPAHLPPGDKGWDWDETAAPGSLPEEHFIQTSLVQRALTGEEKDFAQRLEVTLRKIQERLRREARVTVDNENIDCDSDSSHYRCSDFPPSSSYHFLVVEDSSNGAAIYSVDRKHNSRSEGAIEMAILDALSRHSPSPLTVYASKEAEREIGFVRRLSTREIQNLNAKPTRFLARRSPLEMKLFEPKILELRMTAGLEEVPQNKLLTLSSQQEFDRILSQNSQLEVLFWSNVDAVSVHVFHIWATLSASFKQEEVVLAHVECHKYSSFCTGLGPRDFRTVVAYRDGVNVASTDLLGDEEYYDRWIRLAMKGPIIRLEDDAEVASAKRGNILGTNFPAVSVATFGEEGSTAFKHFKIAAERLIGRYVLAFRIKKGAVDSLATFRPAEKKKRQDYEGRFDPASLISFIISSSEASILDISDGFTTDALFLQPKPILVLEGADDIFIEKIASSEEIRKTVLLTQQNKERRITSALKIETNQPVAILFEKNQVSWIEVNQLDKSEDLSRWIRERTPQVKLSLNEVHPLRLLQVDSLNERFGKQQIMLLPDHTLFQEIRDENYDPSAQHMATGGCPFMSGGGAAQNHDEL